MKNKTAVYNRKVYEIGSPYLFSEHGKAWIYGILTDVDCNYKKPFCTDDQDWSSIKEIPNGNNGTITPAPVEMINGNVYVFECDKHIDLIGIFSNGTFIMANDCRAIESDCTNIREMIVKEGD